MLQDESWLPLKYFHQSFVGCQYFVYSTMLISSAWQNGVLICSLETHGSIGTTFFPPSVFRITYLIYFLCFILYCLISPQTSVFSLQLFFYLFYSLSPFVSLNQPTCLHHLSLSNFSSLAILLSSLMVQYILSSATFLLESFLFPPLCSNLSLDLRPEHLLFNINTCILTREEIKCCSAEPVCLLSDLTAQHYATRAKMQILATEPHEFCVLGTNIYAYTPRCPRFHIPFTVS